LRFGVVVLINCHIVIILLVAFVFLDSLDAEFKEGKSSLCFPFG